MTIDLDEGHEAGEAPERFLEAGVAAPTGVDGSRQRRFSVHRKMAVVARLLRGGRWNWSPARPPSASLDSLSGALLRWRAPVRHFTAKII
jgi:hypothetical protein